MLRFELKRLASGSVVYGIGGILQRFIGLLLLPFFTRALTPEDYGVIALIGLLTVALTGVFNLGTTNSMGVLYYAQRDKGKRPTIIWTNATLVLLNSLFMTTILFAAAPAVSRLMFEDEAHAGLLRLSILGLALTTLSEPFLAYLRMEEKAKRYVTLTLLGTGLAVALSVFFVFGLRLGVTGMILAGPVAQGILLVLALLLIGRHLPFAINTKLFAPLARVGFPSIFGLFAFLLIDYVDRQMLQRMAGIDELGIYSVGYSFGMVLLVVVGAFGTAWPPFFMSFMDRRAESTIVFGKVFKYYVLVFGMLSVMFFAAAKPIALLFVAPAFHDAYVVIGMVAAGYALKGCYQILLPGLYFERKLYLQSGIEWLGAIVNILLNLLLIPRFGIVGAAAATLISYLSLVVAAWVVGRRYLTVQYDWVGILFGVTAVVLCSAALYTSSKLATLPVHILFAVAVSGITAACLYLGALNQDERTYLRQTLKSSI